MFALTLSTFLLLGLCVCLSVCICLSVAVAVAVAVHLKLIGWKAHHPTGGRRRQHHPRGESSTTPKKDGIAAPLKRRKKDHHFTLLSSSLLPLEGSVFSSLVRGAALLLLLWVGSVPFLLWMVMSVAPLPSGWCCLLLLVCGGVVAQFFEGARSVKLTQGETKWWLLV